LGTIIWVDKEGDQKYPKYLLDMETKKCRYCGLDKPINDFELANIIKGKEYRRHKCRRCYQNDKNIWRQSNSDWVEDIKKGNVCKKCGESDFRVLDFHHRDSEVKEHGIADIAKRFSREKILKEIEKCDILCCKCHRILHWNIRHGVG
jgi:hypothetical protein